MSPKTILVTIAVGGTAVALTTDVTLSCRHFQVEAWKGNTEGSIGYLMTNAAGGNIATGAQVIKTFVARECLAIPAQDSGAVYHLVDYKLNADTAGDKFLVTYWQ